MVHQARHPKFYFEDGSVVFQVPGPDVATIYRLSSAILVRRSGFFATLFSIPRNANGQSIEGQDDDNPVILWGIEKLDFDRLLAYMIGGYSVELYQIDAIMSVLKLSAFFEIQDGIDWALALLPQLPTFTASRRMEVARKYRIDDWIEPAFRALMKIPFHELTMDDALSIGLSYYWILVSTRAKIDHHRRGLAFAAPAVVHSISCESKFTCDIVWTGQWWSCVAKQLLHPDAALAGRDVMTTLETAGIPQMCAGCEQGSTEWVKASGAMTKEETILDEGLTILMGLQTDEPIRASMRNI